MRILNRVWLSVIAILTLSFTYSMAEDTAAMSNNQQSASSAPADNTVPRFGMGLQYGAISLDGTNYNSIRLQPVFFIGKFGIGLDVNFEFDANGNFRTSEWNTWQAIVSKVLFVQYGFKKDPVYIKVGSNDDFTLGYGFVMKRYSNMLDYPAVKKLGIAFDLDFGVAGFESMVDNVFLFDILGMRAFYRPLYFSNIPVLNKLEFGATIVADLDPLNPTPPSDKAYDFTYSNGLPVGVYSVDAGLPIVDIPLIFNLKTYAEFAQIINKGSGEALGLAGSLVTVIPYTLEARLLQPKFIPSYFDTYYGSVRITKYDSLDLLTNNVAGWLFSSGLSLFSDMLIWDLQIEGEFAAPSNPTLTMDIKLSKDLLKKVDAQITLIRQNITQFSDIFDFANVNTMLMFNFDWYLSDNLALCVNVKNTFAVDQNGSVTNFSTTSISTKIAF